MKFRALEHFFTGSIFLGDTLRNSGREMLNVFKMQTFFA